MNFYCHSVSEPKGKRSLFVAHPYDTLREIEATVVQNGNHRLPSEPGPNSTVKDLLSGNRVVTR
jgi:hypothetical protein